jgi:hypothetical protein
MMKFTTIMLAAVFALAGTFTADAKMKRHHMSRTHGSAAWNNPNGTAGGPTTLSGTGSSQYGGSSPGVTGKN